MNFKIQITPARPALTAMLLALVSMGIALSTLYVPAIPIKIAMLVAAAILLAATGASLALVLARLQRPAEQ